MRKNSLPTNPLYSPFAALMSMNVRLNSERGMSGGPSVGVASILNPSCVSVMSENKH